MRSFSPGRGIRAATCAAALAVSGSWLALGVVVRAAEVPPKAAAGPAMREDRARDWLARWERKIVGSARTRYCDREMGEELGWLVSPFLDGFLHGFLATRDPAWLDRLVDWADALVARGVKDPDGRTGWPKVGATGTARTRHLYIDSQLGEAMALEPLVRFAGEVRKRPALREPYGAKAEAYLRLSERIFEKWDARGCWRTVKGGGLWVVPPFGIDPKTGAWTEEYARRKEDGFSLPANKQNLVACWLLVMYDATKKPVYRERAEAWFRVMKSRMATRENGRYVVWNYWDPGGPWDRQPDGSPKHWVGVHPNGGYYGIDVAGIVAAHEHGLVFTKEDIDRLVATNRDFMWNQKADGAAFRRIDGGEPDARWAKTPGVLWSALVPYDATLRKLFEADHDPAGWGGLAATPRHLARFAPGMAGGQ